MNDSEVAAFPPTKTTGSQECDVVWNTSPWFVYVSGEGADPNQASRALFGRVKGGSEKDLLDLANLTQRLSVSNLRPAGIDGSESAARPE